MKKIIFINVPKTSNPNPPIKYKITGNKDIEYSQEVIIPIDSILAKTLKKEDDVKVIYIKEKQDEQKDKHYEKDLQEELSNINKNIGAKIEYKVICKAYEETQESHGELLETLIDELEEKAEVSADVTYGAKPLPFIIFNVLTFAAKICNADIVSVIYGKVDFVEQQDGTKKKENPTIFDLSRLYYLNTVSSTIKSKDINEAKQTIKKIINM